MRPSWSIVVATVVLLAASTACGGDDDRGSGEDAPTDSSAATTTTATELTDPDGPVAIAHRGASAYAPEHTFAAYDLALEQGADYLEQDLQLTADGTLVVLHDDTLDRTARGPAASCTGPVADKTLDELRQCEAGSWFNEARPDLADPAFADEPIPTMAEVLERYGTGVRYYIEIKAPEASPGMEQALLELLDQAGLGDPASGSSQVLVQSFSAASLQRLHELRPELPLVQLLPRGGPIDPSILDGVAAYAVAVGPAFADVDGAFVDAAHERCLAVHPYTVDDPETMTALLDLDVDGLFTDAPDVLVERREGHDAPDLDCVPAAAPE